jgi:hypothetical protein
MVSVTFTAGIWHATVHNPLVTPLRRSRKEKQNIKRKKKKNPWRIFFSFIPDCHGDRDGKRKKKEKKQMCIHYGAGAAALAPRLCWREHATKMGEMG